MDELCDTYLADLTRGVRNRFGNGPPDPEDVAQEAFRRIIEKGDTAAIKNLKGFLWRTARNLVLDARKISNARSKYDFEIEEMYFPLKGDISTPENVILAKEQLRMINAHLRDMPEKRRRAFVLYRVEGLTLVEVARRLRISRTAVSNHIAKAHASLNALFIEDADD
ncbi:MAG: RNA polymerase sigma factor [Pseudomonadota bacterium]